VLVPLIDHVAIVSLTDRIEMRDVLRAAAAVQKQITRDFTPFWSLPATVDVFADLESVPSDYHPVILFGDADELGGRLDVAIGADEAARLIDDFERDRMSGLHLNAYTRQPFALVEVEGYWSVVLSHEVLEMIADPYGNRLVAAMRRGQPNKRVKYLLEVCDPCQSMWYPVNGVPVSDFYTPRYFDPVQAEQGRYSFTGAITEPLEILDGGYLSWIDPADSGLYQMTGDDSEPVRIADLAQLARSTAPLRTVVDTNPVTPQLTPALLRAATSASAAPGAYDAVTEASEGAALRTAQAVASLAFHRG
jgi:hypothetical protein